MLAILLIIVVIVMLAGALPGWHHSRGLGYFPSGTPGLILVILFTLLILGRFQVAELFSCYAQKLAPNVLESMAPRMNLKFSARSGASTGVDFMAGPIKSILNALIIIAVVLWLLSVFGALSSFSKIHIGK